MRIHSHHLAAALTIALGLSSGGGERVVQGADVPLSEFQAALEIARTRGVPVIVIVTARDVPASLRLWDEFQDGPWARAHRGLVLVAQVGRESEPALVSSWNVARFPTVLLFGSGAKGVTVLGRTSDCSSAAALAAWLDRLDSGRRAPGELDPSVHTTAIGTEAYPSQQQPPSAPSPPPAAPPAYSPPMAPAYAAPLATTSAGVIQVPSQNYVIQQAPPQIFMAPAQAPIVYVPQAMTTAMMPVAPAPPANVFLPAAPAAPMAPAMAVASFPMAPAIPAAPAVAIPAAVTNQSLALPASQTATRVSVRGPGLFAASLARFGERLVQLGRARIVTTQETVLQPPYPQTASGLTTISTTSAVPVAPPQAPPAAPPQPPVYNAPTPVPQPSPQENQPRKHFLFNN